MKYKKKYSLIIVACLLLYLLTAQLIQYAINDGNVCIILENNCMSKDTATFDVYIDNNLIISANRRSKELMPIPESFHYALLPGFHELVVTCDGVYKKEIFFVLFVRYINISMLTEYKCAESSFLLEKKSYDECFLYIDISTLFFTICRFYA